MRPRNPRRSTWKRCEYFKSKNGIISGCGMRAAWNRLWVYCPYCGKRVVLLNRDAMEDEDR